MNLITKLLFLVLILVSCKSEPISNTQTEGGPGYLVLNEGLFQNNNAGLTFFNSQGVESNYFLARNGEPLGDVATSMKQYGGKIYIVVNNSNLLTVLDAYSHQIIQKISMYDGSIGRSPRNIDFAQGKAYVCSFDGSLCKIDTATLQIEQVISLGRNPEDLCVLNGKIYVSNSGGLDFPNYDSTVSVVDLQTFTEESRISVGINPGQIISDGTGSIYVIKRGDYGSVPSRIVKIDGSTNTVVGEIPNLEANMIQCLNGFLYVAHQSLQGGAPSIAKYNIGLDSIETNSLFDLSSVSTLYGFVVDQFEERIFVFDANQYASTGDVYEFSLNGALLNQQGTGYLPKTLIKVN